MGKAIPRLALLHGLPGTQTEAAKRPAGKQGLAKAKTSEEAIQASVEAYLDRLALPWFHLPPYVLRAAFGWGRHSGPELGAMSRAAAIVRGLPDLLIWDGKGRCLAIELKTATGKLTAAQKAFRAAIGTQVARSFDEAKGIIDAWRAA